MVLAALAVLILGGKVLQAAWGESNAPEPRAAVSETDSEIMLRWQQNHANHWRAYVMQHP
jgi:hypothetical protein